MLYRLHAARLGRRLGRELRSSLRYNPDAWSIKAHDAIDGVTELQSSLFAVTIQPSKQLPAVRLFDRCRVSYAGGDVWLPLIARVRLKNAARLYMARRAVSRT